MAEKLKTCKSCGKEVAKSAKKCPHCGARLGMATWLKVIIVLIVIGVIGAVAMYSCTAATVNTVDKAVKSVSNGSDIKGPDGKVLTGDAAKKPTFNIGDTITVDDLQLTVSAPVNKAPDEYTTTKNKNVAVFHVKATNNGSSQAYISSGDFNLYVNGTKCDPVYMDGVDFSAEDVNSGKTVEGDMGFDIPKGSSFELVYSPNFLTDQEITFKGTN
ncbi:MAG: DUF4352 domain-containing protein [Coriobacteriia bacterium]|nr:DUF4352 domain-containing protein [Coriobacteriia bacterium]